MPPHMEQLSRDESEEINTQTTISVYEQLRPKHESKFLTKVRDVEKAMGFVTPLKWFNIFYFTLTHVLIFFWLGYDLSKGIRPKWQTVLYSIIVHQISGVGITAGVHRFWTHRGYKAEIPLRWILVMCYTMANHNKIKDWVRDHRVHHKFSETSADPHDATRGFFFAHMGWLMMKKHPDVIREGRKIDLSDIDNDPVVQFHTKYFYLLKMIICFLLPIPIAPLFWGERWDQAILLHFIVLFIANLHTVWFVNSVAHLWGYKPYNPNINPVENWIISLVSTGEGWHNYHHTFPWDYKAAELPYLFNLTTLVIDTFGKIGWAHSMKRASPELIQATKLRNSKQ